MKDIVWLINPANDSLDDLFLKMKDLASTVLEGCQCIMSFPDGTNDRKVNLEWKRNMYFIYKESLTNIVKHARATEVRIKARITKDRLLLEVSDNGRGFDPQHASAGNGLKNMRERTRMLGAKLNIETSKDGGTIVSLETRIT
jgi:signal transduction histidine kinase